MEWTKKSEKKLKFPAIKYETLNTVDKRGLIPTVTLTATAVKIQTDPQFYFADSLYYMTAADAEFHDKSKYFRIFHQIRKISIFP